MLYFFIVHNGDLQHTLTAVNLFTLPDPNILSESYGTLDVCRSSESVEVIDAKSLTDVVGMVPFHRHYDGQERGDLDQREFFPIAKMGLTRIQMLEDDD